MPQRPNKMHHKGNTENDAKALFGCHQYVLTEL